MTDPSPAAALEPPARPSVGGTLWAGAALLAAFLGARSATRAPVAAPAGGERPAAEFSAERALARLERVLGDGRPHPVGSAEHARVRARLVAELEGLGYEPEVQDTVARGLDQRWARVRNVLARRTGREPGPAVLLAAHYDSVAAGPGAGDDGSGVACLLEIARALAELPPLRRDVVLLFSDGEEVGLNGARAFAEQHPWAAQVGAAVNVERRGTSGRTLLFETGPGAGPLIAAYGERVRRPATSSLAAEIYRHMPNYTDFTVFLERGLSGANLAAIGGAGRYHTAFDELDALGADTVQHQGESALLLVQALAEGPLPGAGAGGRVYTDVLGRFVLSWPARWSAGLGLLALGLHLWTVLRLRRAGALGRGALAAGFLGQLGLALLAAGLGAAWTAGLRAGTGEQLPWFADPWPTRAGYAALTALACVGVARTAGRRAGFWGLWCAAGLGAGALGLALAFAAPGASYLFLVPGLVTGLLPHVSTAMRAPGAARGREIALVFGLGAAAVLVLPTWIEAQDALGTGVSLAGTLPLAGLAMLLAPQVAAAGRGTARLLGTLSLLALAGAGAWALRVPAFDAAHPRKVNLHYTADAESDEARWMLWSPEGPAPVALVEAIGAGGRRADLYDWAPRPLLVPNAYRGRDTTRDVPAADAPRWGALSPIFAVTADEAAPSGRRLAGRARSLRGAEGLHVLLPAEATPESLAVGERRWALDAADGRFFSLFGAGEEALEIEWTQPAGAAAEVLVFDTSASLPPEAAEVLAARPPDAAPAFYGDVSTLFRRYALGGDPRSVEEEP